jgi:shikimate 5-dehydrogenase
LRLSIVPKELNFKQALTAAFGQPISENPRRTNLVKDAGLAGCTVIGGLGMLVHQGVVGGEHWTGGSPDPLVMRAALVEVFS